jgi:hypothetical protein
MNSISGIRMTPSGSDIGGWDVPTPLFVWGWDVPTPFFVWGGWDVPTPFFPISKGAS